MTACEPRVSKPAPRPACQILINHAVAEGWTTARACAVVELYGRRVAAGSTPKRSRLGDSAAGGAAVHAMTASQQWPILELFRALGRHRRRLSQARAPRLLREPCLGVTLDAVSRTGSSGTCCAPLGRGARRQRRGRGPIVGRPASRDSGDRRAVAIDLVRHPGRAGRCSRRAGAPGRAVSRWDRSSLDRAYRTYLLARPAHQPAPTPTSAVGLPGPDALPTYGPAPPFGPTTHRRDCPPTRPGCGPDLPTALRHRARRPSAPAPALALQHRPTIPADPRAAASAHDPRRSPRGSIGPRSPPIPARQHRPTIPADPHVAASAHDPRRSPRGSIGPRSPPIPTWQHRPTILTGSRPTIPADPHVAASAHRLTARGSIGPRSPPIPTWQHRPTIPTDPHVASAHDPHRLTARGSIGPRSPPAHGPWQHRPSIPARRRPTGSRPVAASAIDPRAASAHRLTARGSIGHRSPRGVGPPAHGPWQHRPSIPARRRPTGSRPVAASGHRSPRGSIGHRSPWQRRPTGSRPVAASAIDPRGSVGPPAHGPWQHRPSIPAQRRPTGSRPVAASAIDPRAASAHRLTARGSIGHRSPRSVGPPAHGPWQHRPSIPAQRRPTGSRPVAASAIDPRGSVGPPAHGPWQHRPSIPAQRRPTGSRPVAASAIDPRAASAHRLTARGSIGHRSPRSGGPPAHGPWQHRPSIPAQRRPTAR